MSDNEHRNEMKQRFLENGFESFEEKNILEFLLSFAMTGCNYSEITDNLLEKFGSLNGVLNAKSEELCQVPGINMRTAVLITMMPQLARRYSISKLKTNIILNTPEKLGEYLIPYFIGERDEVLYMICLDKNKRIINIQRMFQGTTKSTSISTKDIIESALLYKADSIVISHNHVGVPPTPSSEDKNTTRYVNKSLSQVNIKLLDHIIVSGSSYTSMAELGLLK